MIQTVVFDIDDTLYDASYCYTCGLNAVAEYVTSKYGMSEERFFLMFEEAKGIVKNRLKDVAASHNRLLYMQIFLEQNDKPVVPEALIMYQKYWDAALMEMKLFPYVRLTMERLKKKNINIGFLSDLTAQIQYRKLEKLGLSKYVDYLVTSEETGEEKPSEKMFGLMIDKTGNRPEELLMIGDSEAKDIIGAKKAGIHSLLFKKEFSNDMGNRIMEYIENA